VIHIHFRRGHHFGFALDDVSLGQLAVPRRATDWRSTDLLHDLATTLTAPCSGP